MSISIKPDSRQQWGLWMGAAALAGAVALSSRGWAQQPPVAGAGPSVSPVPTRGSFGSLFSNRGGGGSIAANATAVYVLQGNQVYALDARSLRILARTELPVGTPGRPGGPGGAAAPGGVGVQGSPSFGNR